ncbi:unnamed protein product [Amaranthus hypochondriacus]
MGRPMACILTLLISILLYSSPITAQKAATISVGRSLTATTNGSEWLSPSEDFAFGFSEYPNKRNLYLLSIWYRRIPDTIIWYANDGNPVPEGSVIKITADEGLVLSDPQGNNLWNTSISGVNYGFMNDTGNFVLKQRGNDTPVWQTFANPTDTLLPGQIMEINGELNSRLSETNFTKGRFQLRLIPDGNMVLNTRDLKSGFVYDSYYTSETNDTENAAYKVIYNSTGDLYIQRKDGSKYNLTLAHRIVSPENYYQRVTLNFDGVLTWYYHPRTFTGNNGAGWTAIQSLPDNICLVMVGGLDSGACGFNNICILGKDQRPICQCPQNYSLLNPNDTYGSCKPDFQLGDCKKHDQGEYTLVKLPNTHWPGGGYKRYKPISEEDCKNSCLEDCFCAAAVFNGRDSTCYIEGSPLSNGRTDSRTSKTTWLKVGNANDHNSQVNSRKLKYKKHPVLTGLLGGSVFLNLILLIALGLITFIVLNKKHSRDETQTNRITEYRNVHCFRYKELKHATDGFKEEIGRGAFGVVYKGKLARGGPPLLIAVKKLDRMSNDADKEFDAEVNIIGQTHHKNLVRFIGFCKEEDQRLLVYEYMSNSTVADYLFGDLRPSWTARIQIAKGIARGLLYLHEECSKQIIHCDIKPQNILLDEYHNARISDFGLAKLLALNQTHTNTAIRGTKGYVAPEWFRNKPITVKVDVYSFGVLLLEIICCRKSVCMELIEQEGAILTDWAFDCYRLNHLASLMNDDMEALSDMIRLKRLVKVALWCIQEDPNLRPTMRTVTQILDGVVEVPDNLPCPTSFTMTEVLA